MDAVTVAERLRVSNEQVQSWTSTERSLDALVELMALLERKLASEPDMIATVVRRPAPAYGGRSMLDWIRDGKAVEVLETARSSFDFASPA